MISRYPLVRAASWLTALALVSCSETTPPATPPAGNAGTSGSGGMPAVGGSVAALGGGGAATGGAPAGGGGAAGAVGGAAGSGGSLSVAGTSGAGGQPAGAFAWPDGKTAAVSLTYDDGLDAHLAHVVPLLNTNGIKGSFFIASFPGVDHDWALPNATSALSARHQAWLAAAGMGHEIASHTVNHPCVTAVNPGQSAGFRNQDYDLARITAELDDSIVRIKRLGATAPFGFGYPCYSDVLGVGAPSGQTVTVLGMQLPQGQVFTAEVATRFFAARGSAEGIANPATLDIHSVPYVPAGPRTTTDATPTLAELKAIVDMAIAQHGWVVFLMHGVAGDTLSTTNCNGLTYAPQTCVIDYLGTPTATHDGLVAYLASKPEVWTDTFKSVAQHVIMKRGL